MMHERCCMRECSGDNAGAAMAWGKNARSASCAYLGITRRSGAAVHWSAVLKLQPDLVALFTSVRRFRCDAVAERAKLMAAVYDAVSRAEITCDCSWR